MARSLETSYWTVRKQLDELVAAMGYEVPESPLDELGSEEEVAQARMEILERLDRGDISAKEARELLEALEE